LVGVAIFSHAPIDLNLPYSISEDRWHSVFASLAGFSFTMFAVAYSFISSSQKQKKLAIFIAMLATLLSLLMFQVESFRGLWQRLIFISSFAWLIYIFRGQSNFT